MNVRVSPTPSDRPTTALPVAVMHGNFIELLFLAAENPDIAVDVAVALADGTDCDQAAVAARYATWQAKTVRTPTRGTKK